MPLVIPCMSLLYNSSTVILADLCRFHLMTIVNNIEIELPKCPVCSFCRWWIAFICYVCMITRALVLFLVTRDQISIDRESKNKTEYPAIKTSP